MPVKVFGSKAAHVASPIAELKIPLTFSMALMKQSAVDASVGGSQAAMTLGFAVFKVALVDASIGRDQAT